MAPSATASSPVRARVLADFVAEMPGELTVSTQDEVLLVADAPVSEGWSLVIFPEATRSRSGRMGRFRHGAAELARRHGLPVIPAHVDGTDSVLPPGVRWPQAGTLKIAFGDPLLAEEDESAAAFTSRLREAVATLGPGARDQMPEPPVAGDSRVEVVP